MPRAIDKDLRDCFERANPYTEFRIEISEPDVGQVLRRTDQFTQAPSLVSMAPAASLAAAARGALILAPATAALQSFAGVLSSYDLNGESPARRVKGVAWTMDKAFSRCTLKSITAKVERVALAGLFFDADFECQIFRITKTPGVKIKNPGTPQYQSVAWTEYTFTPLLSPAPTLKASAQAWDGANRTTLSFDLTNWNLTLENSPAKAVSPDQVGELPEYLIVVRLAGKPPAGTGHYKWLVDNASARVIANVGTFERVTWARSNDSEQWGRTAFADVPNFAINIETYPATGQAVYLIDQGKVPGALSTGRVDFQRALPPGTTTSLEISTAGSGGPWTAVKHGDVVVTKQQTYHLRVTLNADTALRATPQVNSMGIEFRIPRDVSVEGIPDLPTREVDMPWLKGSIPEGRLRVVRTGIRDFLDVATVIGSTAAAPRLEADIYLASRHPSITRDKWLRLERLMVTNRLPSATSEEFTLLSYASRLKRKIPQKVETINSVHTVQGGSTAAQVIVSPALPGTSVAGNEYDGKGYYMRVRTTAAPNTPPGLPVTIQGNTSTDRLDFAPSLTEALVAGDIIEVHSGIYQTAPVSWVDADPADVWDGILSLLNIPPERIGAGWLPRGGKPPRVTDIAPGDAATQAKRKITVRLSEEEAGDELLDQISTIVGGVTIEKDGQIVFVQIIPLVDIAGNVTVPLPPPAAAFDMRDFSSLSTPPGLERRATIVSCAYGVPATAANPDAFPSKSTTAVDGDALLWLAQQDLEQYGTADVPDNIARWLYNSSDAGLYLAAVVCTQLVKVASTGLRVFPVTMAEKHPELVIGDVVIIATDQYTDYEPSTQTALAGPMAIRGVIVREGREGRDLALFVPGLVDNVQLVKGGAAGTLGGLGLVPDPPELDATFDPNGQLILHSSGDFATASQKIAWAIAAAPDAVTVRAAATQVGQNVVGLLTGSYYKPGASVYVAAFAYSPNGIESGPLAVFRFTREGGAFDPFFKSPHHLTEEEHHRGGNGGLPVPGGRIHAIPLYDDTGSFPLVDTHGRRVGSLLQANDGEAGIESQRAATRKGAQAAGSGSHGITEEEHHRAGNGGIPVPKGRIHALPVYDDTGSIPLIDTSSRRILPALKLTQSTSQNDQGSILPASTQESLLTYDSGGPALGKMWVAWAWSAFTIYLPDQSTIAVGASSAITTPPAATLSQVAGGGLGARTRFARIGYIKNGLVHRVGAEASLAIGANNLLKITSPAAVPGYDGWIALIGSASNGEFFQQFGAAPIAFGTDFTEAAGGFLTTLTPYSNTKMPNAVTAIDLDPSLTYFYYPHWDIANAFVAFPDAGQLAKSAAAAVYQNGDGRIGLSPGAVTAGTPSAGFPGNGGGGGGKLL